MEITGQFVRRIVVFAFAVLVIPIAVFPEQLGLQLVHFAAVYLFYELVYYGLVSYLFKRQGSLVQLAQAAGICLVFRLAIGALFGAVIAALYGMKMSVSLALGMSSYLPALLFHVAATPFVLKPLLEQFTQSAPRRRVVITPLATEPSPPVDHSDSESGVRDYALSEREPKARAAYANEYSAEERPSQSATPLGSDINGFERAVRYIGEHGSVFLAAVVDHEGLLMASFRRGDMVPEDWAPLALLFYDSNRRVLARNGLSDPDRVDLRLSDKRVVTAKQNKYSLMVVADRHSDDVLNIRISQGLEIISKHATERYASMHDGNAERIYVSGTK
jgi:hypothetical protein